MLVPFSEIRDAPRYTLPQEYLVQMIKAAHQRDDVVARIYSGKRMYGRECVGFVGTYHQLTSFLLETALRFSSLDYGEYEDFLLGMERDNMGLDLIFYWPDVDVEPLRQWL